jgi:nucleolar protein 56
MADDSAESGWYEGVAFDDEESVRGRIERGSAESPRDWPALAVESGFATDEEDYYDRLHEATVGATRRAAREAGRADDRQIVHAVRAMDDDPRAG